MTEIDKSSLLKALNYSFKKFLEKDVILINNHNYEPTISGRFAMYLRECFIGLEQQNIFVDVEYNKYGFADKKRHIQDDINSGNIRPDIILHERCSQNNNLIYCEIKINAVKNNIDREKVKEQVKDKKYKFGLFVNKMNEKQIDFQIYVNNNWVEYFYILKTNEIVELTNE